MPLPSRTLWVIKQMCYQWNIKKTIANVGLVRQSDVSSWMARDVDPRVIYYLADQI